MSMTYFRQIYTENGAISAMLSTEDSTFQTRQDYSEDSENISDGTFERKCN